MVYTLRFFLSSKCSLFHNSKVFGSCIIHILYTGCPKIKKNNSDAKRLTTHRDGFIYLQALTSLVDYALIFRFMTPYELVGVCRRYGRTCCLHLQGAREFVRYVSKLCIYLLTYSLTYLLTHSMVQSPS